MGSPWLSGMPVRGDHNEDSPRGEGCHEEISVGSLLHDTSGPDSCADPASHHCMGSLIALHPGHPGLTDSFAPTVSSVGMAC